MITICRFVITSRHGSPLSEGSQNADFGKIDFVHAISCRYFLTREHSIHHNFIQEKNQFVISPINNLISFSLRRTIGEY